MILMIYKSDVFKDILLPNTDNTDYQILIEKNRFNIRKEFYLSLEIINHSWYLISKSYKVIQDNVCLDRVKMCGNQIITIKTFDDELLRIIVVDSEFSLISYEKYSLNDITSLTVGSNITNTVVYKFINLVSKYHCVFEKRHNDWLVSDTSSNGVFINNRRISGTVKLSFGDIVEIFGLKIVYFNRIIAIGSRVGKIEVSDTLNEHLVSINITQNTEINNEHSIEYFNRSPRIFPEICDEEITIEPPSTPQFSKKRPLLSVIGPSFTMAIPMLIGCGLAIFSTSMHGGMSSAFMYTGVITAIGSALFGSMWAVLNIREVKRNEVREEAQRFNIYGNYLLDVAEYIKQKYMQNINALNNMYPSSEECCSYNEKSQELWNRNYTHDDFLYCRLGTGDIDFQVNINIPKEKFSVIFDSLKDKPSLLYNNFKTMKNVPVGINFLENSIYGIAGGSRKAGAYEIVNNIIAQIVTAVSYTDVKIAFCFDKSKLVNKAQWDYIKWLPHIWSENKKIRYFATNRQEASDVFFELSNVMRHRSDINDNTKKIKFSPHYFLFVSDISLLENEIISKYVFDEQNKYGLTTFIMTDYYQNLPNVCENIIENDSKFCGYYNVLNSRSQACAVKFDKVSPESLLVLSKTLANITVREIEDDTSIVSSLDFFEMYNARSLKDFNIKENWIKSRTYNSMRVIVGKKAGSTPCYLDLHEKYHGPHGLIAGTTGSGKSEVIQTLVLSLAINFSPDDISFFIIDFKGGGMANLFEKLPHLAGQISNLSGNQISRAMISIKSENMRRQKLFSEYGVNNINNYTRLYKSGEAAVAIPHLVIIIDEFAELKKEEPDFMRELISVAQVGRSLGVHLILATQKPSGTVDDNIWSNAKFRLCLRVQDRQDSNDMLHKPDAAYITQAGRCYLQVGNDEIYELFQSGWSGAPYDDNTENSSTDIATMITPTGRTAIVGSHNKMKRKNKEKYQWYEFLINSAKELQMENDTIFLNNSNEQLNDNLLAKKLIDKARDNGYNISYGNADVSSMRSFISLIPNDENQISEIIKKIVVSSSEKSIKLPEPKEKTQLEAIVEYIGEIARKMGFKKKQQLWMPLLKNSISLSEINNEKGVFDDELWMTNDKWTLNSIIGLYDDPQNQSQLPFVIDFTEGGHIAVFGSVMSGKSTLLQTMIFSLAIKYSPQHVNFYILDFSSGMLKFFEKMPHVGGVLRENDTDKISKFFNMIQNEINDRKKLFHGGNYSQYVKVNGIKIPSIVIVIDNFAGFKEKTENAYEDVLISISREGVGYGVFLVISAAGFGMAEIQNRIGDNIRTVLSLEMSDKFKYMDVLRISHIPILPESGIKGRGIGFVDGRLLEFQTALAVKADDDYKRYNIIDKICKKMRTVWNGETAPKIPFIPEHPLFEDFSEIEEYKKNIAINSIVPFAYDTVDASVYNADLSLIYCYSIVGKKRTGKTNLLKIFMNAAYYKHGMSVVIEKEGNELKLLANNMGFSYLSSDIEIFEYFKSITQEFSGRNKLKHKCLENGLNDEEIYMEISKTKPIFIFIADLTDFINSVYNPSTEIKNMSGFFENIVEKGYLHNIYFFACINCDNILPISGYKLYQLFTSYKTGVLLGGNVSQQRIFNFQNIHFTQMSKTMKKGEGLTPSSEDETIAHRIIVPLVGGSKL